MSVDFEPKLLINVGKIQHNTQSLVSLCEKYKIKVNGVTKATLGDPIIARAMKQGGASLIADSRIQNIQRMIEANIQGPFMLLRSPMMSEISAVVRWADISLNSELEAIKALGKQAKIQNKTHKIILMVEMGDLREGEMPEKLIDLLQSVKKIQNIELLGLGMNLTCYGAIIPTEEKIQTFSDICKKMEQKLGSSFQMISGGNSSTIPLLLSDRFVNPSITDLRLGESILLGRETVARTIIPGLHSDAFILEAEIIELKKKPSLPSGVVGEDAFGNKPIFVDKGMILHALVALGHQDIGNYSDLIPVDPDIEILGASSDHLIINVKSKNYKIGDKISFGLKYGALLAAYTSPFVQKCYI
jgi:predicted amino acid racemase